MGTLVEGVDFMLNGIHHVSINVQDVDAAIRFYVGVLGMEQIERPDLGFPGAWLKSRDQELHLLGIESTPPPKEQHFAFAVDDLTSVTRALEAAGFVCSKTNEIPGVCLQAFTHDPSGNMVEFNQRLA
jgi:glyoxylase I family protein